MEIPVDDPEVLATELAVLRQLSRVKDELVRRLYSKISSLQNQITQLSATPNQTEYNCTHSSTTPRFQPTTIETSRRNQPAGNHAVSPRALGNCRASSIHGNHSTRAHPPRASIPPGVQFQRPKLPDGSHLEPTVHQIRNHTFCCSDHSKCPAGRGGLNMTSCPKSMKVNPCVGAPNFATPTPSNTVPLGQPAPLRFKPASIRMPCIPDSRNVQHGPQQHRTVHPEQVNHSCGVIRGMRSVSRSTTNTIEGQLPVQQLRRPISGPRTNASPSYSRTLTPHYAKPLVPRPSINPSIFSSCSLVSAASSCSTSIPMPKRVWHKYKK